MFRNTLRNFQVILLMLYDVINIFGFLIFILFVSLILNGVLGYTTWNLLKRNEEAEDLILHSFSQAQQVLHDMREIDRKEMFEKDDEVGVVFGEMVQIVEYFARVLGVEEVMEDLNE